MSSKQVNEFMKDKVEVFMILASMKAGSKAAIGELPGVCDFPKVYPNVDYSKYYVECMIRQREVLNPIRFFKNFSLLMND